ncbi:hypothetical protein ACCO45_005707 [Purpureocillium lilacinum]|uniref:Uncharacterized protein n=1 Tax=Purpureocillium lilacinum TaxID=33203 RepID=A0ACC4DZ24_PURLI
MTRQAQADCAATRPRAAEKMKMKCSASRRDTDAEATTRFPASQETGKEGERRGGYTLCRVGEVPALSGCRRAAVGPSRRQARGPHVPEAPDHALGSSATAPGAGSLFVAVVVGGVIGSGALHVVGKTATPIAALRPRYPSQPLPPCPPAHREPAERRVASRQTAGVPQGAPWPAASSGARGGAPSSAGRRGENTGVQQRHRPGGPGGAARVWILPPPSPGCTAGHTPSPADGTEA